MYQVFTILSIYPTTCIVHWNDCYGCQHISLDLLVILNQELRRIHEPSLSMTSKNLSPCGSTVANKLQGNTQSSLGSQTKTQMATHSATATPISGPIRLHTLWRKNPLCSSEDTHKVSVSATEASPSHKIVSVLYPQATFTCRCEQHSNRLETTLLDSFSPTTC